MESKIKVNGLPIWAYKAALRLSQIINKSGPSVSSFALVKDEEGLVVLWVNGRPERLGVMADE